MSLSKDNVTCPVLDGPKTFQIWNIRIVGKLHREQVADTLKGKPTAAQVPLPGDATGTHLDTWDVRDGKAHGIIIDHISDCLALKCAHLDAAEQLYNELVRIHQAANLGVNAFYVFSGLMKLTWDGTSSVDEHIALPHPVPFIRAVPQTDPQAQYTRIEFGAYLRDLLPPSVPALPKHAKPKGRYAAYGCAVAVHDSAVADLHAIVGDISSLCIGTKSFHLQARLQLGITSLQRRPPRYDYS
ncbi:hypothetical protein DFH08DRAFT_1041321 [Mycena albidolilacea]|uniref:Uncharacterized protein n=1 Tax=Mycena albidolilacea TaxID=1033008 RepID=A0AAD6ZBM5_9AGAR|nr:hypothetical protein DFH08DRAFT_1041321 [Mycena albidolilacea]